VVYPVVLFVCADAKVVPPCVDMNVIRHAVYSQDHIFMITVVQTHLANTENPSAVTRHPTTGLQGSGYHRGRRRSEWVMWDTKAS
jgi:hypothetical protein